MTKKFIIPLLIILSLCSFTKQSEAAITLVTNAHISADLTSGSSTSAIDTTGGNLLTLFVSYFSSAPTITDSKSNTWILINHCDFSGIANLDFYYAKNAIVGSGHTITSSSAASAVSFAAFSGADITAPLDQNSCTDGNFVSTIQPGSITPSVNNTVVVSGLYYESGTVTSVTIVTKLDEAVGGSGTSHGYVVQTTATAANPLWTMSDSQTRINAAVASFKSASAATGGNSTIILLGVGK